MRMHRRAVSAAAVWMVMTLALTGCTSEASNIGIAKDKKGNVVDTGFTVSTVGSYDSADTAVVLSTDLTNKAVSLVNMDTGKQYTLYYDGTTYVKDKYDGPMTISQIKAGDVVDVTFLKGKKKLASIKRSPEAWIFDDLDNYDLAGANRTASIGSLTYALPDEAVVLSEGRRVEKEEVMAQDVVTISGIDHKIYSVKVDKGHGYLRLKNDQPLLGGWIEVGNSVIRQITEDMLLVVPEGSYQVVLSNNGVGCVKEITVERNKEVVLDVGDVEIAEDKTGMILFNVTPETASVSVDGKPVDISKAVEMRYGIHQVQVEASGYDTLTKYIQVGSEYATISFTLEESRKTDNDKNSVSGNTTERIPWQDTFDSVNRDSASSNTLSTLSENALGTSSNYKVYIDSPKGVEVYLDGNYIGLAPVRFTKSAGTHQITLRKNGYETKSYTIYLTNDRKDETYSFSDLRKIVSDDENSGNSGNDGNSGDNNDGNKGDIGEPPLPPDDSEGTTSGDSTGTPTDPDDNEGDNNDKDDGDQKGDGDTGDGDDKGSSEDGNGGKDENSESGEDGDDNDPETGGETGNSGGTEEQNAANSTTTKAHPIRD
nr:PEGA domain-containing protein [Lachnospiraceae bacterium]